MERYREYGGVTGIRGRLVNVEVIVSRGGVIFVTLNRKYDLEEGKIDTRHRYQFVTPQDKPEQHKRLYKRATQLQQMLGSKHLAKGKHEENT